MLQQTNIVQVIKNLHPELMDNKQLNNPKSDLWEFLDGYFINFSHKNLDKPKRIEFKHMLAKPQLTDEVIWNYLKRNIPDFEQNFTEGLSRKLTRMIKTNK